jgi:hypothetical protein
MGSIARARQRALRVVPAVIAAAALTGSSAVALAGTASTAQSAGPTIKLYAAQLHEQVVVFGRGASYIDPSIYVESLGQSLQFDVQRKNLSKPITITQILKTASGATERRTLPAWTLNHWNGLNKFIQVKVQNGAGKVLASRYLTFCPDGNAQRATPDSPAKSPYPYECSSYTPFVLGTVWGIEKGWGVDPEDYDSVTAKLQLGKTYKVTMTITKPWQHILHVSAKDATAAVKMKAVTPAECNPCSFGRKAKPASRPATAAQQAATAAQMQRVPLVTSPPESVLPDLLPLPSWGISVQNGKAAAGKVAQSHVAFGATVSVLGNGPLDVEGFNTTHSAIMPAYQYFWRGSHLVGRARAGTMGFDNEHGHHHWHFEQFAQYRLLGKNKKTVVRSHKVGFCIAPTDAVNLLVPHADWQPTYTGFTGECGAPGALWVQEMMPLGWGDTYFQSVAGQTFNITNLPNGVYYIEIIANPEHVLHETNLSNDISLRKIIIGGTTGHRTVRVPAYHGIDPEN